MPKLFRIGGYIVFFWSNENDEPIHVHICVGDPFSNATKIWLSSKGGCIIANNNSKIPAHELNKMMDIISAQFFYICSRWKEHFLEDVIRFFS